MALDEGGICEERRKRGEDTDGETMRGLETRRVLSSRDSLASRKGGHTETHDTRINRAERGHDRFSLFIAILTNGQPIIPLP